MAPARPRRAALSQPRLRDVRIPRVVLPAARRSRDPRRARAHPPDAAGSNGGSIVSLAEFQRAFADLIASPQACVEARRRPAEAFAAILAHGARDLERLRAIVMDDGMAANCTLYRVNRLVPVYGVMPLTCRLLGTACCRSSRRSGRRATAPPCNTGSKRGDSANGCSIDWPPASCRAVRSRTSSASSSRRTRSGRRRAAPMVAGRSCRSTTTRPCCSTPTATCPGSSRCRDRSDCYSMRRANRSRWPSSG